MVLSRKIIIDNDNEKNVNLSIFAFYFIDTNRTLRIFSSTKRSILVMHTLQSIQLQNDEVIIKLVL